MYACYTSYSLYSLHNCIEKGKSELVTQSGNRCSYSYPPKPDWSGCYNHGTVLIHVGVCPMQVKLEVLQSIYSVNICVAIIHYCNKTVNPTQQSKFDSWNSDVVVHPDCVLITASKNKRG